MKTNFCESRWSNDRFLEQETIRDPVQHNRMLSVAHGHKEGKNPFLTLNSHIAILWMMDRSGLCTVSCREDCAGQLWPLGSGEGFSNLVRMDSKWF